MKITNNAGLPQAFVNAAGGDGRHPQAEKTYSVTQLEKSVREILLAKRHDSEIERDASDMIWMVFGTAVHSILEQYGDKDAAVFTEERLTAKVSDCTVSGIIDMYDIDRGLIVDYKTASHYKIQGKDFKDWEWQGQAYGWLLRKNGLPANKVEFYAMIKDHSKAEAARDADYPQTPVVRISFDITDESFEAMDKAMTAKIEELRKYELAPDDELPECSEEDRWNTGRIYAVTKKGNQKSKANFSEKDEKAKGLNPLEEATALLTTLQSNAKKGEEWYIDVRPGEDKKCGIYCSSCMFCSQFKERHKDLYEEKLKGEPKVKEISLEKEK